METATQTHDFMGQWITTQEFSALEPLNVFHRQLEKTHFPPHLPQNRHILFRRSFDLDRVAPTTLYITADDYYKLYINGTYVSQGPCPGYPFHYYYNTLDVTDYLRPGRNVIAVHTYYQGLINRVWVSGDCRHGLLLDLCSEGRTLLCSDETFVCHIHEGFSACGISGYDTQFMERYDARAAQVGFEQSAYDDSAWPHASVRTHLDYTLFAQPSRQLQIDEIHPAALLRDGQTVFIDFGAMYVGGLRLTATGDAGSEIRIRCGQELLKDGSVRYQLRANCCYEEYFVLSGGIDTLNQYDYKAFRYAELTLPPNCRPDMLSICLVCRHYPFSLHAAPNTDDPDLLRIFSLCVRAQHYGVQEVIQDCTDREKGQYLGDGCFTALTHMLLSGDPQIACKLIDDSLRSAFINKGLMTCSTCSFMQEIAEYPLMLPLFELAYWHLTRDTDKLEQWYTPTAEMLDFYRDTYEQSDHLLHDLDKWCVVEWPQEYRDGYDYDVTEGRVCKGTHNIINAYYIGAVKTLNKIAAVLNKKPYRDVQPLQDAYVKAFYDPHRHLFRDSQTSDHISMPGNMVAFQYNICPEAETEASMLALIRERGLTSTMFYVTAAMLCALKRTGHDALLRTLIASPDGWLRSLREGATVTMEGWGMDAKWNTSLFHLVMSDAALFLTDWGFEKVLEC